MTIHNIIGCFIDKHVVLYRKLETEIKRQNLIYELLKDRVHPGIEKIIYNYDNRFLEDINVIITDVNKNLKV